TSFYPNAPLEIPACHAGLTLSPASTMPRWQGEGEVGSEIRLVGDGNTIIEEQEVALGADLFAELSLSAPVAPDPLPRLIEGFGIIDSHEHFHRLPVVDHAPTLDHVQSVAVRR